MLQGLGITLLKKIKNVLAKQKKNHQQLERHRHLSVDFPKINIIKS